MYLTYKKAIEEHRNMWNWIAEQTKKNKQCVSKQNYFDEVKTHQETPYLSCYCCHYDELHPDTQLKCKNCPVIWPTFNNDEIPCCINTIEKTGLYEQFLDADQKNDWETYAKIAEKIANLPENPNAKQT